MQKFNLRNPLWQANYYDRVICDGRFYKNIVEYIRKNPEKWYIRDYPERIYCIGQ